LERVTRLGWCVLVLRLVLLLIIIVPGVILTLVLRVTEPFFFGTSHPMTARLQRWAIWAGLRIIGLRYRREGRPMRAHGAVVANHASWMDIFALGAG